MSDLIYIEDIGSVSEIKYVRCTECDNWIVTDDVTVDILRVEDENGNVFYTHCNC